jgi:hypothetical protein
MKKSISLLAILGTLIAGCSGDSVSSSFSSTSTEIESSSTNSEITSEEQSTVKFSSFSELKVDLTQIKKLAVYKNNQSTIQNGRKNQVSNQNSSILVGYNEEGDLVPIIYLNSEDQQVTIPYNLFSIEIVGDFSYLIYIPSPYNPMTFELESFEQLMYSVGRYENQKEMVGRSLFVRALHSVFKSWQNQIQFILLHNESGKLFDMRSVLNLFDYVNNDWSLGHLELISLFKEKIYFFVSFKSSSSPTPTSVCKVELAFNNEESNLDKIQTCTSIPINPIFISESGYFIYQLGGKYYFASSDLSTTGDFTYYSSTMTEIDGKIIILSGQSFIVFDSYFNFLTEIQNELLLEFNNNISNYSWFMNKNGYDIFGPFQIHTSQVTIFKINFQTFQIEKLEIDVSLNSAISAFAIIYEGSVYLLSTEIIKLDQNDLISTLDDNIFSFKNSYSNMAISGYVEYYQVQGLNQINKYLNLQTGEIFLESESRPTITVTQVQPIN